MGVSCIRILCEFMGHNFVSGLRTLKPKKPFQKPKKTKNLKVFSKKNLGFSSPQSPSQLCYHYSHKTFFD